MNGCGATLNGEFWYFGNGKKVSFGHDQLTRMCDPLYLGEQNYWMPIVATAGYGV